MRLGCFGTAARLNDVRRAGFDAMELDLMELSLMDDSAFGDFARACRDSGLAFEAFSGFMPLSERIHSPNFDEKKWLEHAKRMGERSARLGARVWPMGAGKPRSIPEGANEREAGERVLDFFAGVCRAVAPFGIDVAIEPLGSANSNYLNKIGQAVAAAKAVGLPNCRAMCDLRHMENQGEAPGEVGRHAPWIAHAHVDFPLGTRRLFPQEGDGFDYRPYVRALVEAGIPSLAVEATEYEDFASDAARSAAYLRSLIREAQIPPGK